MYELPAVLGDYTYLLSAGDLVKVGSSWKPMVRIRAIKVAVHRAGHAVLVIVRKSPIGAPQSTATIKLSRVQWSKLKQLAREG